VQNGYNVLYYMISTVEFTESIGKARSTFLSSRKLCLVYKGTKPMAYV